MLTKFSFFLLIKEARDHLLNLIVSVLFKIPVTKGVSPFLPKLLWNICPGTNDTHKLVEDQSHPHLLNHL